MDADLERNLHRLVDEAAITRRLVDYCRGVDRLDAELVASVYHPDGTDDHGSFQGLGVDFAEYATSRLVRYRATQHTVSNPHIRFAGPDTAHVECHVLAQHCREDDEGQVLETFGGRYVDRFERRDGEWKIAHRVVVHEWSKLEHVELAFPPDRFTEGRRDREDVSYGIGSPA